MLVVMEVAVLSLRAFQDWRVKAQAVEVAQLPLLEELAEQAVAAMVGRVIHLTVLLVLIILEVEVEERVVGLVFLALEDQVL
jgi:hypothetical protein